MKKKIIISLFFLIPILGIGSFVLYKSTQVSYNKACPFCNTTKILKSSVFYEDDLVMGFFTHKPVWDGHCLVVPKRHFNHFENILDEELLASSNLIKKIHAAMNKIIGPHIYFIVQKNGYGIQSVPHLHFHYIPKKDSKNFFAAFDYLWNFLLTIFKSPIPKEELFDWGQRMKAVI